MKYFIFIDRCAFIKIKNYRKRNEKKNLNTQLFNFSSAFYFATNNVNTLSMIEKCVNKIETKHIVLKNFNLHHSL